MATAYEQWQQGEGIPIHQGAYVGDLYTVELGDWARVGQRGAFVNLAGQQVDDAHVIEIAPRSQTEVMHHLFEAVTFVLEGRGATTLWQEGSPKRTVEWQRGSVFSPPLNCYYQHFNGQGDHPGPAVHRDQRADGDEHVPQRRLRLRRTGTFSMSGTTGRRTTSRVPARRRAATRGYRTSFRTSARSR